MWGGVRWRAVRHPPIGMGIHRGQTTPGTNKGSYKSARHDEADASLGALMFGSDDWRRRGWTDDGEPDMQVRAPLALAPEPEPERETPTTTYGPGVTATPLVDSIDWPTKNVKRVAALRSVMEQVGELHGMPDNGMSKVSLVLGSNVGGGKGGHFSPSRPAGPKPRRRRGESYSDYHQRYYDWRSAPRGPEIRVNTRNKVEGEEEFFMLHEIGHRMDCRPLADWENKGGRDVFHAESGYRSHSPEAAEAFSEFMGAARATPNIADAHSHFGHQFARYHRDVKEIWARAYCQWACNKVGGAPLNALGTMGHHQWPDEEFEELAPLVEKVLRATGAMKAE